MPDDLDPEDWDAFRAEAHRMLDAIIDYTRDIRARPVWQKMPDGVREHFGSKLPRSGRELGAVCNEFLSRILPYSNGNPHPRFMGWVQGGSNPTGIIADMLAAGLNDNLGGRDHAAIAVERQVVRWMADLFGWPQSAGGLLVTGSSIANFMAVLIARVQAAGAAVRRDGSGSCRLMAYTSTAAHTCIARAIDMAGLGTDALRLIPTDDAGRMRTPMLQQAIERDRASGLKPFLVIATAGTVDIGAIDELPEVAALCRRERIRLHIDGALGALGMLATEIRPKLAGIEQADSIAFDFHKWGQVPYDAGCLIVRDQAHALDAFAAPAAYLRRETRGLAGGAPWPTDLGPDLSRGFRALKVWFMFNTWGADRIGATIQKTCQVAQYLAELIDREPLLERLSPVALNIVCFRYRFDHEADRRNAELVTDLQESGAFAPSTTTLGGRVAIRAALVNHRVRNSDAEALVRAVLDLGSHHP